MDKAKRAWEMILWTHQTYIRSPDYEDHMRDVIDIWFGDCEKVLLDVREVKEVKEWLTR